MPPSKRRSRSLRRLDRQLLDDLQAEAGEDKVLDLIELLLAFGTGCT